MILIKDGLIVEKIHTKDFIIGFDKDGCAWIKKQITEVDKYTANQLGISECFELAFYEEGHEYKWNKEIEDIVKNCIVKKRINKLKK